MANEIKKTTKISWSKGGAQILIEAVETIDQAGEQAIQNVQIIGGTSEALIFGDVVAPAHVTFKNLNKKWSDLTTAEKTAAGNNQTTYEENNRVFVGTTNPTTANDAIHTLYPGSGTSFFQTIALAWYACKATDNVNLLVSAIEA